MLINRITIYDRNDLKTAIGGNNFRLASSFWWSNTPQGKKHWLEVCAGNTLSPDDITYLYGMLFLHDMAIEAIHFAVSPGALAAMLEWHRTKQNPCPESSIPTP